MILLEKSISQCPSVPTARGRRILSSSVRVQMKKYFVQDVTSLRFMDVGVSTNSLS